MWDIRVFKVWTQGGRCYQKSTAGTSNNPNYQGSQHHYKIQPPLCCPCPHRYRHHDKLIIITIPVFEGNFPIVYEPSTINITHGQLFCGWVEHKSIL